MRCQQQAAWHIAEQLSPSPLTARKRRHCRNKAICRASGFRRVLFAPSERLLTAHQQARRPRSALRAGDLTSVSSSPWRAKKGERGRLVVRNMPAGATYQQIVSRGTFRELDF